MSDVPGGCFAVTQPLPILPALYEEPEQGPAWDSGPRRGRRARALLAWVTKADRSSPSEQQHPWAPGASRSLSEPPKRPASVPQPTRHSDGAGGASGQTTGPHCCPQPPSPSFKDRLRSLAWLPSGHHQGLSLATRQHG